MPLTELKDSQDQDEYEGTYGDTYGDEDEEGDENSRTKESSVKYCVEE